MHRTTRDNRALLVYDDACGACRAWVRYWRQLTGERVRYTPFRDALDCLPHIPREDLERAIQYVEDNGKVFSGAQAAYKTLSHAPGKGYWLGLYRFLPGFSWLAEMVFSMFLRPNPGVERVVIWLWGGSPQVSEYRLVSGLFLRLLALIYLVAFISIGVQILGLAGSEGIVPFAEQMQRIQTQQDPQPYWFYPTLFWFSASDLALQAVALAGCLFAVLLFLNRLPRVSLILLFVFYLSLFHAGGVFMNFQWDYLLLEAGFLAIFLTSGSQMVIFLFRWLLFRFRFLSGAAKLLSQDPSWSGLTALGYYFETQPLPHLGSWIAHQFPDWLLRSATTSALFIELVIPFMMFLPRGPRFIAAWATLLMQFLIILTSNHNFFNLLTIALCLFLFDDRALSRVIPQQAARWLTLSQPLSLPHTSWRKAFFASLASLIVFVSVFQIWEMFSSRPSPEPAATLLNGLKPLRIVNKYHVFPTIKTERIELIIEGSQDGQNWYPYVFKYKPGDPNRQPDLVIPHQPRLDWMMWFAPMGYPPWMQQWMEGLLYGLLDNSSAIIDLLKTNPFPEQPPRYLRVETFRYHFTDPQTRTATGQWWEREYLGPYYPLPWVEGSSR